jgi:poly-gamma-glutamate synthesis protein (capsule biosynthesis protein)
MFAQCDFVGDTLTELRLYPIDLGFKRPRSDRGRPMLADTPVGDRVLKRVQRLSAKYGTKVEMRDGVGVVKPAGS